MRSRNNFGPKPPHVGTFYPQPMIPHSSSNSHCGANPGLPVQGIHPQNWSSPLAMNNRQPMPQNLPSNSVNPPSFYNQHQSLGFQNQIHVMGQPLQPQVYNLNPQFVPGSVFGPQGYPVIPNAQTPHLSFPQNGGIHMNAPLANFNFPQNVAYVGNGQLGLPDHREVLQPAVNFAAQQLIGNSINLATQQLIGNSVNLATQQLMGSSSAVQGIIPVPPSQNQTNSHARSSKFQGNQRNAFENNVKNNRKPSHYKNHKQNPKHGASMNRIMKHPLQKRQNSKGKSKPPNKRIRRGKNDDGGRQISVDKVEQKRLPPLKYTDKEIKLWREERRKNYPSKANIEKKLMQKMTKPEIFDEADRLRRQRLKEVLAKQAELGCEVAEIPSYYLDDLEQEEHDRKKKKMNGDLVKEKEPSLLQKLLKADINRDKHHLMQALRFMALNSFFQNWPKNQLKFPQVMVKETEDEIDLDVENSVGNSPPLVEIKQQPIGENDIDACYSKSRLKNEGPSVNCVEEITREEPQGEEGEIID